MSTRLAALAVLLGLTVAPAADVHPVPTTPRGPRGLAGQLLVATEGMRDPRFAGTVLYMVRHDPAGAMGLVLNRPLGDVSLAAVLDGLGRDGRGVGGTIRVHYGGPVEPERGFVLHTTDWASGQSHVVQDGLAVTADPAVFEAIARGAGPRRVLFAVGYAGWAPHQLDTEMQKGDWASVPADEPLVFDEDARGKWKRALSRRRTIL